MELGVGISLTKKPVVNITSPSPPPTYPNQLLSSTGEILKDIDGKNLQGA